MTTFHAPAAVITGSNGRPFVALTALADALGVVVGPDPRHAPTPIVVTTVDGLAAVIDTLAARAVTTTGDGRALVLVEAGPDADLLTVADGENPIVFRTTIDALVPAAAPSGPRPAPAVELRLRLDRAVGVGVGQPLAVDGDTGAVAVATTLLAGRAHVTIVGSSSLIDDRSLPLADNAALVGWALTGTTQVERCRDAVRTARAAAVRPHPAPETVQLGDDDRAELARLVAAVPHDATIADETFTAAASRAARLLPARVHDALVDFADRSHPSGAMVVRGLPVGDVPPTPASPRHHTDKDRVSEFVLLTVARRLGQPVGYEPEHGGELVQNLVPTAGAATAQTSTSSAVMLEFHTEAAFHPHKPRFLLLLGLRADPFGEARTLLCSIDAVVDSLTLGTRAVLAQPRFRTGVDESYLPVRDGVAHHDTLGRPVPVLSGDPERPALTFDADLMVGIDTEAEDALQELRRAVREHHIGVALGPGDLLVVDNHAAVHGRSPFRARFDGTDRWLQRSFVVSDLAASAGERSGRVITTRFA